MTFEAAIGDILTLPEVQRLGALPHHGHISRLDHSLRVARWSYQVAHRLGWNERACARAGLLHDLFYQRNLFFCRGSLTLSLTHPEEAARNAARLVSLTPQERNIILAHMWPLARHWPASREAWLVSLMDKTATLEECFQQSHRVKATSRAHTV
jgi:uncharacterized protein